MQKKLILGTALWGWTVDKKTCFNLLDTFYKRGFRSIDTAKNYPINGNSDQFQFAEKAIAEWTKVNMISDLDLICKIGSISNEMVSKNKLSRDYIDSEIDRLKDFFGSNLNTIMIHWDNRSDQEEITDSLSVIQDSQLQVGLSGIAYPGIYSEVFNNIAFTDKLIIEIKYNFIQRSSLLHYSPLQNYSPRFYAYGISVSGLKMNKREYKQDSYVQLVRAKNYHKNYMTEETKNHLEELFVKYPYAHNIYDLAVIFSEACPALSGYIVGPNSLERLIDIFKTIKTTSSGEIRFADFNNLIAE